MQHGHTLLSFPGDLHQLQNTTAQQHHSKAFGLQNTVGVAGLSRLKQNPQVPRDYKENVVLKDLFIYLNEYLLTKVPEGQSETSY